MIVVLIKSGCKYEIHLLEWKWCNKKKLSLADNVTKFKVLLLLCLQNCHNVMEI